MQRVTIAHNPFDNSTWTRDEVEDIRPFLMQHFEEFPANARIYHGMIAVENDVTPTSEAEVERLGQLEGDLWVVLYPQIPLWVALIIVVVAVAAIAFLLRPSVPNLANRTQGSANNELAERTNKPRPFGRIPDIFGQVTSTPDLLGKPFSVYEDHKEVEIAYMCIGRGSYSVTDVKDGDTLVEDIAGASVEVYAPNTSPNSGSAQLTVGDPINEPVRDILRLNDVNGQVLRPPNNNSISGDQEIRFVYPDTIELKSGSDLNFTASFVSGDIITVGRATDTTNITDANTISKKLKATSAGALVFASYNPTGFVVAGDIIRISNGGFQQGSVYLDISGTYEVQSVNSTSITLVSPASVNGDWNDISLMTGSETPQHEVKIEKLAQTALLDFAGTYEILSVSSTQIVLVNPATVNSAWTDLGTTVTQATNYLSVTISTTSEPWVGPFTVDMANCDQLLANFVALNGLFKDNGTKQTRFDIQVLIEATPIDTNGTPTGAAQNFTTTVVGNDSGQDARAKSLWATPTAGPSRFSVRAKRTTPTDLNYEGTVVDEVKWKDLYGVAEVPDAHFGNVTTVMSKTYATNGALAIKERKLNMLVTRKVPIRTTGTSFGASAATLKAHNIITEICRDEYIGNRALSELNLDNIYDTIDEVETYFNDAAAAQFCYTFDDDNMSFEETIAIVANAVFCTAYRQGNQINLYFEKATTDSVMLFNHRNKHPGTEKRTVRFGVQDDHDGVELEYAAELDDAPLTYSIPVDRSAINPKNIKVPGVRNDKQAYWQAWRAWNKLRYQNTAVEFTATQEAAIVINNQRVLVADNTRSDTQDGEVMGMDGLIIQTSQPVTFEPGETYTIFLQLYDGSVQSLTATAGVDDRHVVLGGAPNLELVTDPDSYARTGYILVKDSAPRTDAFLIKEKDPDDNYAYQIKAANYSSRFYDNDHLVLHLDFTYSYDDQSVSQVVGVPNGGSIVTDGTRGKCYDAGSASHYLSTSPTVELPDSYTKAAWVNRDNVTQVGYVISSITGSSSDASIGFSGTNSFNMRHNNAVGISGSWGSIPSGTWAHIAATYDAVSGVGCLYRNGVLVATGTFANHGNAPIRAVGYGGGNALIGRVDDIRVYNRAFSASEVRALYLGTIL